MPCRAEIRNRIAAAAADVTNNSPDHYLGLLGEVEAVGSASDAREAGWRLVSYHGTSNDGEAIERAVSQVHRAFPFISV